MLWRKKCGALKSGDMDKPEVAYGISDKTIAQQNRVCLGDSLLVFFCLSFNLIVYSTNCE